MVGRENELLDGVTSDRPWMNILNLKARVKKSEQYVVLAPLAGPVTHDLPEH